MNTHQPFPYTGPAELMPAIDAELDRVVPREMTIEVELVWHPAWSAERMSPAGKAFMGW